VAPLKLCNTLKGFT